MSVNRDLTYPRAVLETALSDLNGIRGEKAQKQRAACELACKILEMYEGFDSVEMVAFPPHVNGG